MPAFGLATELAPLTPAAVAQQSNMVVKAVRGAGTLPYITHVLRGHAHLSWEQAEAICRWLGFTTDETDYFLLMVGFTRAGTPHLRLHLERKLEGLRENHLSIKRRVQVRETLAASRNW